MPHDILVFLCYASDDKESVSRLYDDLHTEGLTPWMESRNLLPGEIWEERIRQAIKEADFFLACLSRNATDKRGFIQAEIKQALRLWEEKGEGDIYLIPVKLEDCQLPESLSNFHFAAIYENDGLPCLIKAIRKGVESRHTTLDIFERKTDILSTSVGYLSPQRPSFQIRLSLLDQHKFEHDYLPRLKQSLIEQFGWEESVVYRVLLFMREISENAFKHGCNGDVNRKVDISANIFSVGLASERIVMNITSPGEGFDISKYMREERNRKIDDLSGMGLILSANASDMFTYSSDGKVIQSVILKKSTRTIIRDNDLGSDNIHIIVISHQGSIDHENASRFQAYVFSKAFEVFPDDTNDRGIILDLSDVSYISSLGLRVLILLGRELRAISVGEQRLNKDSYTPLVLNNPSPAIREQLRKAHFDSMFPICDSIEKSRSYIIDYYRKRQISRGN